MTLEVLVATMWQKDPTHHQKMNLQCNTVIANQCDMWDYQEEEYEYGRVRMISTVTRGVGLNRNIAMMVADADILLFADDDMTYSDGKLNGVKQAFDDLPDADVIIFSVDLTKKGEVFDNRHLPIHKMHLWNALKYGTYAVAIRKHAVLSKNLSFTQLFGGGCIYGAGEDSLFIRDCFKAGLKVYSHSYVLGKCAKDSSSWFTGFNEKYLYDKGAWIACAFPKSKHLIKWYFIRKFAKRSGFSLGKTAKLVNRGIAGFKTLAAYDSIKDSI